MVCSQCHFKTIPGQTFPGQYFFSGTILAKTIADTNELEVK